MFKKEVSLLVSCCSKILGTLLTNHSFITCTTWLQIFLPSLLHALQLVPHHTQHASKSILQSIDDCLATASSYFP